MSKGDFLLRLDAEDLECVRKAAAAEGISASEFIREGVRLRFLHAGIPRPESRAALLSEISEIALKVRAGYVLVPAAEALPPGPPDSWSGIMDSEEH